MKVPYSVISSARARGPLALGCCAPASADVSTSTIVATVNAPDGDGVVTWLASRRERPAARGARPRPG